MYLPWEETEADMARQRMASLEQQLGDAKAWADHLKDRRPRCARSGSRLVETRRCVVREGGGHRGAAWLRRA